MVLGGTIFIIYVILSFFLSLSLLLLSPSLFLSFSLSGLLADNLPLVSLDLHLQILILQYVESSFQAF